MTITFAPRRSRATGAVLLASTTLWLASLASPPPATAGSGVPRSYWLTCGHLGIPCLKKPDKRKKGKHTSKRRLQTARVALGSR